MNEATARSRILLIDDHPLFRKGVTQLLSAQPDFEVAGEAASATEGLALARALAPDLILLDLNMRGANGLTALRMLREAEIDTQVVILTVSDAEQDLVAAVRGGADGYLLKDSEPEELLGKLRLAARGQMVFDAQLTGALVQAIRDDTPVAGTETQSLTERERQILELIASGLSNKLIARDLGISDGTVKVHVKNLLRKLGLHSRLEAAVWALGAQRR